MYSEPPNQIRLVEIKAFAVYMKVRLVEVILISLLWGEMIHLAVSKFLAKVVGD